MLLTFLISLGTILITWMLALPIGIYSAVKQYTPGNCVLPFLGFIGMSLAHGLCAAKLRREANPVTFRDYYFETDETTPLGVFRQRRASPAARIVQDGPALLRTPGSG